MSALDKAVAELDAKRTRDGRASGAIAPSGGERVSKEFFDADHRVVEEAARTIGVQAAFDGTRILLLKPEEGVYADSDDDRGRRAGR